ncbi:MAG: hypothetical protein SGPRY_012097 [Prymnesium sp.]
MDPSNPNLPLFSGLLAAAYLLGQFIGSPFYGGLSEHLGRRPVLLVCVCVSTAFLLAFGFSHSYWLSLALRFLQGATAGALTVGKLYLSDISDATNEGRVFSFIGIAMGTGCIAGPAVGGYLADPELRAALPPDSALGEGGDGGGLTAISAALYSHTSSPVPLLAAKEEGSPSSSASSSPPLRRSSSFLEAAMSSHASRVSLIISDDSKSDCDSTSPYENRSSGQARHVSAVSLALEHSMSPVATRASLFVPGTSPVSSHRVSPKMPMVMEPISERGSLPPSRRKLVFWTIQLASLVFTMTNVGLTDVLPVWLSSPRGESGEGGGLGLQSSAIGKLQSFTGIGNIGLALFFTYRIIQCAGPVNTFILSLHINALAAFCTPAIELLPPEAPSVLSTILVSTAYHAAPPPMKMSFDVLSTAARNMGFATAIMLSKESAPGAPGVAIGINQSACSLGSAVGPILCGLGYTQSLWFLHTSIPFFIVLGMFGLTPGGLTQLFAPRWPWTAPGS